MVLLHFLNQSVLIVDNDKNYTVEMMMIRLFILAYLDFVVMYVVGCESMGGVPYD